jgi:leader peptidase (prepilin peptidase)/N-methyltransferase
MIDERVLGPGIFVFGLILGSFFNVVIARLPKNESIVRPGSKCPRCGHELSWYENIPVLSWLVLRGKCRSCKAPISFRYVAVELLTGVLFYACYARFGWTYELLPAVVMAAFLVPLTFIDAECWILPLELTIPGIVAGIAVAVPNGWEPTKTALVGGAIAFCAFRAVEYFGWLAFKKEAMGAGDKLLAALLCSFLGARALLGIFLLSSMQGSLFGVAALAISGRAGPKQGEEEGPEEAPPTMTWEFTKPGLSVWRRIALIPYCIFWQPIPDDPKDVEGQEIDWKPGPTNLPFGPWLALAGLEIVLIGPWLAERVPYLGWVFSS